MKINNISNSQVCFNAKLVRKKNDDDKSASKSDLIKSYDKQIEAIQAQKKRALELDEFMHSKKIAKLLEKLPQTDEIRVSNELKFETDSEGELKVSRHKIGYFQANENGHNGTSSISNTFVNVQKKDGSINKDKITRYLQTMIKIYQ